jgi:integrase
VTAPFTQRPLLTARGLYLGRHESHPITPNLTELEAGEEEPAGPATTPRRVKVEPGVYRRPGGGSYEIGWRDAQGKQRWRTVTGGIRAAHAALAEEVARRGRGERITADPRLKFDAAAEAWWEARVSRLRPATHSAYAASLKHLRVAFGGRRLTDIDPTDVARFVGGQQAAGLKGWTIKGQLTALSGIFKFAGRHLGYVGANPVLVLDKVERPNTDDENPKRILSGDELDRLLAAVPLRHRLIFAFAAETGARLAEALGIAWGDIDTDAGTVHFTHQLDRNGRRVALKTARSRRYVEITPGLAARLREHKIASPHSGRHDLVFATRHGTGHDHRNIGGRVMARAVKLAGLGPIERDERVVEPAPTFHSLRHTHGSALIASGWDIEEVSARLGHASTATTQPPTSTPMTPRGVEIGAGSASRNSTDGKRPWKRQTAPNGTVWVAKWPGSPVA